VCFEENDLGNAYFCGSYIYFNNPKHAPVLSISTESPHFFFTCSPMHRESASGEMLCEKNGSREAVSSPGPDFPSSRKASQSERREVMSHRGSGLHPVDRKEPPGAPGRRTVTSTEGVIRSEASHTATRVHVALYF